jgi:hypothetical protein
MRLARGARGQSPYCTHVSTAKFLKWPLLFRLSYAALGWRREIPPTFSAPIATSCAGLARAAAALARPAGFASVHQANLWG